MCSRTYRTRTAIIEDIKRVARLWEDLAEAAAIVYDYPRALRYYEIAQQWEKELKPTPRPERSLADGGFNTDGVSG